MLERRGERTGSWWAGGAVGLCLLLALTPKAVAHPGIAAAILGSLAFSWLFLRARHAEGWRRMDLGLPLQGSWRGCAGGGGWCLLGCLLYACGRWHRL